MNLDAIAKMLAALDEQLRNDNREAALEHIRGQLLIAGWWEQSILQRYAKVGCKMTVIYGAQP